MKATPAPTTPAVPTPVATKAILPVRSCHPPRQALWVLSTDGWCLGGSARSSMAAWGECRVPFDGGWTPCGRSALALPRHADKARVDTAWLSLVTSIHTQLRAPRVCCDATGWTSERRARSSFCLPTPFPAVAPSSLDASEHPTRPGNHCFLHMRRSCRV